MRGSLPDERCAGALQVFVLESEVIGGGGLKKGQRVLLELNSQGRRGLEARKVELQSTLTPTDSGLAYLVV